MECLLFVYKPVGATFPLESMSFKKQKLLLTMYVGGIVSFSKLHKDRDKKTPKPIKQLMRCLRLTQMQEHLCLWTAH